MPFATPYDIANRGIQHLGLPRFSTFTDQKREALEAGFAYDKLRRAELRRGVWTFATRRMILRPKTATTSKVSFATYAAATAYTAGDIVADSNGYLWLCKTAATGTTPGTEGASPKWVSYFGNLVCDNHDTTVTYLPGDMVVVSSVIYICVAVSLNHLPANASFWHVVQGATATSIVTYSPIGYEPSTATAQRNIFYLPANFMRIAPQDPKKASNSRQNVMAGMRYNDWEIEGTPYGYTLASSDQSVAFVFRFVADTADVPAMDDMYCEAVGARIAIELCEMLTGNTDKLQAVTAAYDRAILAARTVSAIEAGTTEEDFTSTPAQPTQGGRG